jgi:PKD repeat protein
VFANRLDVRAASTLLFALALAGCNGPTVRSVDRKPVADFKVVQSTVRPQVVTLDAAQSFATVGDLTTYFWTFGDEAAGAQRTSATTATFQHAYTAAGTFTITLVVADNKGTESDPVTQTVNVPSVNNEAPHAVISGPSSGNPGSPLSFDGSGSTPANDLKLYSWDFGDGQTAEGADKTQVNHTFANAGTFKVTLKVTDSLGQNDTTELNIAVGVAGPVAVCNWSPNPALQGVPLTFNGSSSTAPAGSNIVLYVWTWGDGSSDGTGVSATHTYNTQATFKPKLKVLDNLNRFNESSCSDVVVQPPPLCSGDYSMTLAPGQSNTQSCGGANTTWGGNKITLAMAAGGTITGTEAFNGGTINYSGTWSGNTFTMTGQYDTNDGFFDYHNVATINGTWVSGCNGWNGTYNEQITIVGVGQLCTLTWNLASSKL